MKLRRNLFFYLSYQVSRFIFPAILTPYLAQTLKPAGFSDFVIWNSCVWATSLLMEFGFYIYGITQVALAKDKPQLEKILGGISAAKAIMMPLACAAYWLGAWTVGLVERQPQMVTIGIVALIAYGSSISWYYQGLQRGGTAVLLEFIPQLIQFALVFAFVRHPSQVWVAAALQAGAAALTMATSIVLLRRDCVRLSWHWSASLGHLKASLPFFIERASYTLYATAAPLILTALSSSREAAFYGLAEKVNIILTAIVGPLSQAATPIIMKSIRRNPPEWKLPVQLIAASVFCVATGATVSFFAIGPFVRIWFDPSYAPAVPVARWFCLVSVVMTAQLITANLVLIPVGLSSQFVRASIAGLVSSLALQFVLVPRYGASGSAIARVVAEVVILCYFALLIQRLRPLKPTL